MLLPVFSENHILKRKEIIMRIEEYNRKKAVFYAKEWAFKRNPVYYAFDNVGGDCTSFVSQCLYAGSGVMNYTPIYGWYYINSTSRSPSWSGVEFLYDFLTTNVGIGPFAHETNADEIKPGDVIQLGNKEKFYHSLLIVGKSSRDIYVAAHNFDAYMRALNSYAYDKVRYLHIEGVRI